MLLKYIFVLLCFSGQRAELFELLDDTIPILKVFLPDEEFIDLKNKATIFSKADIKLILPKLNNNLKLYLLELQKINFKKIFKGYNFSENISELQVNENGFLKFDIEEIINGFDYNPDHYEERDFSLFYTHFFETNKNFNILNVIEKLKEIEIPNAENRYDIEVILDIQSFVINPPIYKPLHLSEFNKIEKKVKLIIKTLKKINFTESYPEYDFNEILPELQIGEDGYAKFNEDKIISGFNFDLEYYKENYIEYLLYYYIEELVLRSNKNFDLYKIKNTLTDLITSNTSNLDGLIKIFNEMERDSSETSTFDNTLNNNSIFFGDNSKDFKSKNANMTFEINGGVYSREFPKPNYNLKIRGGEDLYGRSQLKLRADSLDPTLLRSKLISDIHDRLGLKSSSANYLQLYINNEYMGLYIITDMFKLSWAESVFGDKNSTTLYKCNGVNDLTSDYSDNCINENDDVTDNTEWITFVKKVENAKSASDLEDIFEVDFYLYEQAIEYLTDGWDHIKNGHNYYFYKQPNGKWIYLSYDFDFDFGIDESGSYKLKYSEFGKDINLNRILIIQDSSRFNEILKYIVNEVFNPATLFPRIDELKQFIKPFIELDKTPNSEGKFPGQINESNDKFYSMDEWDGNSEFTSVYTDRYSYGIKQWIILKYRNVCNNYNIECDPFYMDNNIYPIIEDNVDDNDIYSSTIDSEISTESIFENLTEFSFETPTETISEYPTESISEYQTEETNENITSSVIEDETVYDVDVPTSITDDESFSEEDEEEVGKVKTVSLSSIISMSTKLSKKITITKTKTKIVIKKKYCKLI
ncbi:hypothetical protein PIROE2DRAFT_8776 [Piromyces sp. E2]|nr:hypothetical protein PIROE2DRAFT_8776 [Piromyces sp. E2]|eukprot:OUM64465.1 hypothetical protein PIROE2DRAFT_8776 [Piromyces sp. E2]